MGTPEKPRHLVLPRATAILFRLAAVAFAVVALAVPIRALLVFDAEATLNIPGEVAESALAAVEVAEPVQLRPTGEDLTVLAVVPAQEDPPWWLVVGGSAGTAVWAAALAAISLLLGQVAADIAGGRPFNGRQSQRLSIVGGLVLVASFGADSLNLLDATLFVEHFGLAPTIDATGYFGFIPPAIAATVLVFAGAFRAGQQLQEDAEGLV